MDQITATKNFDPEIDSLPAIMGWVEGLLASIALPLNQIQLALEEAIVNIISHAKGAKNGKITISFTSIPEQRIIWELRDCGDYFDPLQAEPFIDRLESLEMRREGGLGILLMRKYMDELYYRREEDQNVLTLIRHIPPKP